MKIILLLLSFDENKENGWLSIIIILLLLLLLLLLKWVNDYLLLFSIKTKWLLYALIKINNYDTHQFIIGMSIYY